MGGNTPTHENALMWMRGKNHIQGVSKIVIYYFMGHILFLFGKVSNDLLRGATRGNTMQDIMMDLYWSWLRGR